MGSSHPDTIDFAGDYNLNGVILQNHAGTGGKFGEGGVNIQTIVQELNIYESIFNNAITGTLVIGDTKNQIARLRLQGLERISFKVTTPGQTGLKDSIDFTEETGDPLHVYKITDRRMVNQNLMTYKIHFASREFLRNIRTRVSQAYSGRMDQMVASILGDENYLDSRKRLFFQKTRNQDKIVVPNLNPFAAIGMMARRSLPEIDRSKGAGYLFYETTKGFHFRSWESLCVTKNGEQVKPKQRFRYIQVPVDRFGHEVIDETGT